MADQQENPKPQPQRTHVIESGAFVREVWRCGDKKNQRTRKIKPNMKKVVLGMLGDFEVYIYPFDYPDKVFIGKFPVSTMIDSTNVQQLLGVYNRSRWFLSGEAFNKSSWRKGANSRRRDIVTAYDVALNEKRGKN